MFSRTTDGISDEYHDILACHDFQVLLNYIAKLRSLSLVNVNLISFWAVEHIFKIMIQQQ